jgi:hypothetical protein
MTRQDGIRGEVGRSYILRVTARDGSVFESTEERLHPGGEIEKVYYQFEKIQPKDRPTEYGYRIFVDSRTFEKNDAYVRWKFLGTYVVETQPKYHISENYGCVYEPLFCSGYNLIGGVLQYVQECFCCRCYVPQYEDRPTVKSLQFVQNGKFNKVEVGFVPVNYYTFYERYRVEVQQMSISKAAFDFWKSIRDQQDAITSIFQPISGRIPTNMKVVKGKGNVRGIFYASAIARKQIYLDKSTNRVDIRTPVDCLGRVGPSGESCLIKFPDATTIKPPDWID